MAEMAPLNVTVTVEGLPTLDTVVRTDTGKYLGPDEGYEYHDVTLGADIVAQATKRLLAGEGVGELRKRIDQITNEEIRTTVRDLIAAQLAKGFRKTNSYGEPIGELTTLAEIIVAEFQSAMKGSGTGYNHTPGLLTKMLQDAVSYSFEKELRPEIDKAKKEAVAVVQAKAAQFVANAALSMKNV
jgi:hypothetical protein